MPKRNESRFPRVKIQTPGPGHYQTMISTLSPIGSKSRVNSLHQITFNERTNNKTKIKGLPGPGSYQMPTEFGYYGFA